MGMRLTVNLSIYSGCNGDKNWRSNLPFKHQVHILILQTELHKLL